MPFVTVGTQDILGRTFDVRASASQGSGTFQIYDPETEEVIAHGEKLEAAITKTRAELNRRKVPVEVPFVTVDGHRATARGLHGRTRVVLATYDDTGEKFEVSGYGSRANLSPDISDEQIEHLKMVREAERDFRDQATAMENEFEFPLRAKVEEAIEAGLEQRRSADMEGEAEEVSA